jgi:hypothetical protein
MAAGMRIVITVPRLPIMACPMVRKVSGVSEAIERLRPSHVPQNTPVTSADRKMLMICQVKVVFPM